MPGSATVARRADAVLVVIDIQERLATVMPEREAVGASAAKLIKAAELVGVPIVATRQNPNGLGDFEPSLRELLDAVGGESSVTWADKMSFDCFAEPAFSAAVAHTGRRQLLIAGMETHICVAQTALAGLAAGFDVHVIADACCSRTSEAHESALARLRAAGVAVTVTESVLYELVGMAGTDEFRALLRIVKE